MMRPQSAETSLGGRACLWQARADGACILTASTLCVFFPRTHSWQHLSPSLCSGPQSRPPPPHPPKAGRHQRPPVRYFPRQRARGRSPRARGRSGAPSSAPDCTGPRAQRKRPPPGATGPRGRGRDTASPTRARSAGKGRGAPAPASSDGFPAHLQTASVRGGASLDCGVGAPHSLTSPPLRLRDGALTPSPGGHTQCCIIAWDVRMYHKLQFFGYRRSK